MAATLTVSPSTRPLSNTPPPPLLGRSTTTPSPSSSLPSTPQTVPLSSPPSPSPLTPSLSSSDLLSSKRTRLIAEIRDTERHYSSSIARLITDVLHPLRVHASEYGVKAELLSSIFSNLEQLSSFHAVLSVELDKALTPRDVCSTLLRFVDFLRMYIPYVNGYGEAMKALQSLSDNRRFARFAAERKKEMGLDLMSYLIMPVQRIPRYELLLKELKRSLDPDGPPEDAALLDDALAKIVAVAQKVNEAKREAERVSALLAIAQRVAHVDAAFPAAVGGVNAEHRRLVREGVLYKKSTFGKKARAVYLFNDALLWCTSNHKYKGHVGIKDLRAVVVEEKEEGPASGGGGGGGRDGDFPIEVSHPDCKTMTLSAESAYDRQQWLNAFAEAVEEGGRLDPALLQRHAQVRHERSLSVSTSKLSLQPGVGDSNSPVSPASPHPQRVAEEDEDPIAWEHNALKDPSDEEKEAEHPPPLPPKPIITPVPAAAAPQHSRQHSRALSRVLDIKPSAFKQPPTPKAAEAGRKRGHSRNVSVVITTAGHSRKGSRDEVKEEKARAVAPKVPALSLNTASPVASKPATPSSSASSAAPSPAQRATASLASLSRNDMLTLKKMKAPPSAVKMAIESLAVVMDLPLTPPVSAAQRLTQSELHWLAIQGQLVKPTFLKALMETEAKPMTDDQVKRLKAYVTRPELTVADVTACSQVTSLLWRWVRGRYEAATGETLPGGEELRTERKGATAKVNSGMTARSGQDGSSRPTSAQVSRHTTPATSRQHSRQPSVVGSATTPHAGVSISRPRISPSAPSPSSRPSAAAVPRPPTTKDPKAKRGSLTPSSSTAAAASWARKREKTGFSSLDHVAVNAIFAFLPLSDQLQSRTLLSSVSRRCLNASLHVLLDHNLRAMASLSHRRTELTASLTASLTQAGYKAQVARVSGARVELMAALSGVTSGGVKAIKALVKPPPSVVAVFEAVLVVMEGKDAGRGREKRDMATLAHKSVVGHPRALAVLAALTPRGLHAALDGPSASHFLAAAKGVDAAAVERSVAAAAPFAQWVVSAAGVVGWMKEVGWAASGAVVEAEDADWRLRNVGVEGTGTGREWEAVKEPKVRQYLNAIPVYKLLRAH